MSIETWQAIAVLSLVLLGLYVLFMLRVGSQTDAAIAKANNERDEAIEARDYMARGWGQAMDREKETLRPAGDYGTTGQHREYVTAPTPVVGRATVTWLNGDDRFKDKDSWGKE
jgi:hypothetical protein